MQEWQELERINSLEDHSEDYRFERDLPCRCGWCKRKCPSDTLKNIGGIDLCPDCVTVVNQKQS